MKHINISFLNRVLILLILFFISIGLSAQIKVACIGNSITAGFGLKKEEAYPAQMQKILGDKYDVRNYGVSGRTLLSKGDHPYIKEKAYSAALAWQPNIVVIKLGTNDSKPVNWQYKEEYVSDYIALVSAFKALPAHPKVYVCFPIPAFEVKWGINDSVITREIIPMVKKVAKKTRSKVINLYKPFKGQSGLVFDGIHPNVAGDKYLAEIVGKAIR